MRLKKRFLKRAGRGRMADRNRELVPANWSLVRERALTTGQLNAQLDVFSQRPQVCQFESGQ